MRKITILAAGVALAVAPMAAAQAQSNQAQSNQAQSNQAQSTPPVETPGQAPAPAQPPAAAPEAPAAQAPAITSVTVVDIEELPEATQQQVDQVVAQRGDEDLKQLRSSIDSMPELKSALEAKGATTNDVIAASMAEGGALTLITKKAS